MKVRVTIEKNSKAAESVKEFIKQKDDFREAVKSGRVKEYAEENKDKISQPVRHHEGKWDLSI